MNVVNCSTIELTNIEGGIEMVSRKKDEELEYKSLSIEDRLKVILKRKILNPMRLDVAKEITPNIVGVYRMIYDGKVIYVGRSVDLGRRLRNHWKDSHVSEILENREDIEVDIITCIDVIEAKILESTLIRFHSTAEKGWNIKYEG